MRCAFIGAAQSISARTEAILIIILNNHKKCVKFMQNLTFGVFFWFKNQHFWVLLNRRQTLLIADLGNSGDLLRVAK